LHILEKKVFAGDLHYLQSLNFGVKWEIKRPAHPGKGCDFYKRKAVLPHA